MELLIVRFGQATVLCQGHDLQGKGNKVSLAAGRKRPGTGQCTYHGATIVHVVLILVSMSTEIHHSRHTRKRPSASVTKATVGGLFLKLSLKQGGLDAHAGSIGRKKRQGIQGESAYHVGVGIRSHPFVQGSNISGQSLQVTLQNWLLRGKITWSEHTYVSALSFDLRPTRPCDVVGIK